MNEREHPWSPEESRRTESPPDQRHEHRAATDVQQDVASGPMGSQQPPQPPASGGTQSTPPQTGGDAAGQQSGQGQHRAGSASPMIDIVETPEELVVYADVPGYDKEAIHIHADANTLSVSADRSSNPPFDEEEGERGLVVERPTKFERTVPLPIHVDPEEASASYEDGVCKVTIPKEEGDKRREIGFQ